MRTVTVRMPDEDYERLEAAAYLIDTSMADLVREAVRTKVGEIALDLPGIIAQREAASREAAQEARDTLRELAETFAEPS